MRVGFHGRRAVFHLGFVGQVDFHGEPQSQGGGFCPRVNATATARNHGIPFRVEYRPTNCATDSRSICFPIRYPRRRMFEICEGKNCFPVRVVCPALFMAAAMSARLLPCWRISLMIGSRSAYSARAFSEMTL